MSAPPAPPAPSVDRAAAALLASLNRSGGLDRLRKEVESRIAASDAARLSRVTAAAAAFLSASTHRPAAQLLAQASAAALTPDLDPAVRADVASAVSAPAFARLLRAELRALPALPHPPSKPHPPAAHPADDRERFLRKIIGAAAVRKPPSGKPPKRAPPKLPEPAPTPKPHAPVPAKGKPPALPARDPKDAKRPRPRDALPPLPRPAPGKDPEPAPAPPPAQPTAAATPPAEKGDAPPAPRRRRSRSREPAPSSEDDSVRRMASGGDANVHKGNTPPGSAPAHRGGKERNSDSSGRVATPSRDETNGPDKRAVPDATSGRRSGFAEMAAVLRKLEASGKACDDPVSSDNPDAVAKLLDGTAESDMDVDVVPSGKVVCVSPEVDRAATEAKICEEPFRLLNADEKMEASKGDQPSYDPKSATTESPKRANDTLSGVVHEPPAASTTASEKQQCRGTAVDKAHEKEGPCPIERPTKTEDSSAPKTTACTASRKSEQCPRDDLSQAETAESHALEPERGRSETKFTTDADTKRVQKTSPKQRAVASAEIPDTHAQDVSKSKRQGFIYPGNSRDFGPTKPQLQKAGRSEDLKEVVRETSLAKCRDTGPGDSATVVGEASENQLGDGRGLSLSNASDPDKDANEGADKVRGEDSTSFPKSEGRARQSEYRKPPENKKFSRGNRVRSTDDVREEPKMEKVMESEKDNSLRNTEKKRSRETDKSERTAQSGEHGITPPDASGFVPDTNRPSPKRRRVDHIVDAVCVPEDYEQQQKILRAMRELMEKECAEAFLEPVDPGDEGCETYYDQIKYPMDLGTISKRLEQATRERGHYANSKAVMADIELVWSNCMQFNGELDLICADMQKCSVLLSTLFEKYGVDYSQVGESKRRRSRVKPLKKKYSKEHVEERDKPAQRRKKTKYNDVNDGQLVGKTVTVFVPQGPKRVKTWMEVEVTHFTERSKSYTIRWLDSGKVSSNATFGINKMYPVFRP